MKKLLCTLLFLIVLLLVVGSCTTDKMTYISKDYEIYGTWVNPEYEVSFFTILTPPKIAILTP